MKKYILISIVITSLFLVITCSKESDIPVQDSKTISLDQRVRRTTKLYLNKLSIDDLLKSKGNGELLDNLFNSSTWSSIPMNILSDISLSDEIIIADYTNSSVQTLSFKLNTNMIYKYLVFYHFNGEFIPVIASSENREDKIYLSVSDLASNPYFDFYVNNNNKMGLFRVHMNMPQFKYVSIKNLNTKALADGESTCREQTTNFEDCMLCAIDECAQDWLCTVVCAIMTPECLAGFGISCLFE